MKRLNPRHRLLPLLTTALLLLPGFAAGWEELPALPQGRSNMASAVVEDTLFLIGGSWRHNNANLPTATVLRFDLAERVWLDPGPPLLNARSGATAVLLDGRIYVFGGRPETGDPVGSVEMLEIGAAAWQEVGTLLPAREGLRAFVRNDSIFVTGGSAPPTMRFSRIDVVLPQVSEDSVTIQTSLHPDTLPTARAYHSVVPMTNGVYFIGGYALWPLNDAWRWDMAGWTELDTMSTPLRGLASAGFNLYGSPTVAVSGGQTEEAETDTVRMLRWDGVWRVQPSILPVLPSPRRDHLMISYNNELFVFGGSYESITGERVLMDDVHVFDTYTPAPEPAAAGPRKLQLRAYPNPGNSTTTFTLQLPEGPGRAMLAVYNVLGRRIATWSLPAEAVGAHRISWDATLDGRPLPAGVYFLRASKQSQVRTIKLVRLP
jgi:hypothetical protein